MPSSVIIKVGGDILKSGVLSTVAADIAALARTGTRVIMVHGGGPQASALQRTLGLSPKQVGGRRVTDEDTLDVMKMVVGGKLNIDLCAALIAAGAKAVGLHGASSLTIRASRRPPRVIPTAGPDPVDLGLVGDVVGFNIELLTLLLEAGHVPVLPCLGCSNTGQVLNINADVVANELAVAIGATHLVLITGAPGVLRDLADSTSRIPTMTPSQARAAIADGTVAGGMIPKLEESIRGLDRGIGSIHIVGHLKPGDLARELHAPGTVGTALVRQK